jgi:carbon monoxide dehydrogenase subunit G
VGRIRSEITIDAPPAAVWARLADIADHVSWMADAAEIRFTGERRAGVGTTFECDTRVGPLRTTDVMEVTEWREAEAMGVRHTGLVTGTGRFVITAQPGDGDRARLTWDEDLAFPWWLGGPVGAFVARPVLRAVWRGNLRRFAALVTSPPAPERST